MWSPLYAYSLSILNLKVNLLLMYPLSRSNQDALPALRSNRMSSYIFIFDNFSMQSCIKCSLYVHTPDIHMKDLGSGRCMKTKLYINKNQTRGLRTMALCLTAAVGMTLAIFCRLVSKTHGCRLNQLKSGLPLTQYLTMHASI